MASNTRYKDSVFSFLFSAPDTLRKLYGAIEGVTLPPDIPVTINTLSNVLFMERINDISFEIGGKLVILIEHQSTINPNMTAVLLRKTACSCTSPECMKKHLRQKFVQREKTRHTPP